MVSGPALSGKSTLLNNIQSAIPNVKVVSTDDIRMELYQSYEFKIDKESEIWRITHQRIGQYLEQGHVVAIDATLRSSQLRHDISKRYSNYPILYLAFEKPSIDTLIQRNELRKWKQFPTEVVKKMHDDYEFPSQNELKQYTKSFIINLSNIETIISHVVHWINQNHLITD